MLKAMSGSDDVKDKVNQINGIACILQSMVKHIAHAAVAEQVNRDF